MSGRSRRHLSGCAGCATYRADLRRADQTMKALAPADRGCSHGSRSSWGSAVVLRPGRLRRRDQIGVGAPIAAKMTAIVCCAVLVGSGANGLRENAAAAAPRGL